MKEEIFTTKNRSLSEFANIIYEVNNFIPSYSTTYLPLLLAQYIGYLDIVNFLKGYKEMVDKLNYESPDCEAYLKVGLVETLNQYGYSKFGTKWSIVNDAIHG